MTLSKTERSAAQLKAGSRMQIADCRLQIADCRLQIADCRLQIADCIVVVVVVRFLLFGIWHFGILAFCIHFFILAFWHFAFAVWLFVRSFVCCSFVEFWSFGVLEFWSFGVLEFWHSSVRVFVRSFVCSFGLVRRVMTSSSPAVLTALRRNPANCRIEAAVFLQTLKRSLVSLNVV